MRLNRHIAFTTGYSRRSADALIKAGKVTVNGEVAETGTIIRPTDTVVVEGRRVNNSVATTTIILNKPIGYVCSRNGQGSKTIYDLLPKEYAHLKSVGRLDKDSSGLLLLTNDGKLAQNLTHPQFQKQKVYKIELDKPLSGQHKHDIERGIELNDGPSHLKLAGHHKNWHVTMKEGRNRQIRRTFEALGYSVMWLHRIQFGPYKLNHLRSGTYTIANPNK